MNIIYVAIGFVSVVIIGSSNHDAKAKTISKSIKNAMVVVKNLMATKGKNKNIDQTILCFHKILFAFDKATCFKCKIPHSLFPK